MNQDQYSKPISKVFPFVQDTRLIQNADVLAYRLIDSLPLGLLLVDAEGNVVLFNRVLSKIFGYEQDELTGIKLDQLIPPESRAAHGRFHQEFLRAPEARIMGAGRDLSGIRKDGTRVPLEIGLNPIRVENQTYVLATVIDTTERMALKRERDNLQIEKERSEAASQAKSAFLAHMSHEIRTPLAAILGFTQVVRAKSRATNRIQDMLGKIERNARHLAALVEDILDVSKIEAHAIELNELTFSLATELDSVLSLVTPQADTKRIALKIKYEVPIPEVITTDPLRLRQVLVNLISNAIKFSDVGSDVEILAFHAERNADHHELTFLVKDRGCGIAEEDRDKLFKAFSQLDQSPTQSLQGTGLGLVIAKNLAQLLGGDVTLLESAPGRGSTFQFTLQPKIAPATRFLSDISTGLNILEAARSKLDRLAGVGVLLVEDSKDLQALYKLVLEESGATVELAESGESALAVLATKPAFQVVVMDIKLPQMDACEATRQLRALGLTIPVIALSGGATDSERDLCLEAGISEVKIKGLRPLELVDAVFRWTRS